MSQTPSILLERDKSHSNEMLAQRLRSASVVQLELNVIGVNDAVFDVPPVVVEAQRLVQRSMSSCHVVLRSCRWCPRCWISSPSAAAAHQVDGLTILVELEAFAKAGFQASCFQWQRRFRRACGAMARQWHRRDNSMS